MVRNKLRTSAQHSTQHTRYDRARVAQLDPIREAIGRLGLSPLSVRQLRGILNAIEIQIEVGGDSPDVNALLIDALRAALRHQVDERAAQPALRAIDTFIQAEDQRWKQVEAGTLPPIELTPEEQIDELMQEGYTLMQANQRAAACDRWLETWERVKQLAGPELRSSAAFDDAHPGGLQLIANWCSDLEMELGNAGLDDPIYHEHRIRYVHEFLAQFPDMSANTYINFRRAEGEALWYLGRRDEAEAVYAALIERLPDEGWGYVGWADHYWLFDNSPKDYARGEAIMRPALARPGLQDRDAVLERLADLYGQWGKPTQQSAIAAQLKRVTSAQRPVWTSSASAAPAQPAPAAQKLGRNAPCWCGSGRKYKHCHLDADRRGTS
jgi:tetratricopeptide (TPR) repeat protein